MKLCQKLKGKVIEKKKKKKKDKRVDACLIHSLIQQVFIHGSIRAATYKYKYSRNEQGVTPTIPCIEQVLLIMLDLYYDKICMVPGMVCLCTRPEQRRNFLQWMHDIRLISLLLEPWLIYAQAADIALLEGSYLLLRYCHCVPVFTNTYIPSTDWTIIQTQYLYRGLSR